MKPSKTETENSKLISAVISLVVIFIIIIPLTFAVIDEIKGNHNISTSEEFHKLLEIPEVALYVDSQNYWDNQRITHNELLEIKEYQKDLEFRKNVKNNFEIQQK